MLRLPTARLWWYCDDNDVGGDDDADDEADDNYEDNDINRLSLWLNDRKKFSGRRIGWVNTSLTIDI